LQTKRNLFNTQVLAVINHRCLGLCLGPHLFAKVPRPEDSEVTFPVFESSCHLLLPVQPLKGKGNPVKCLCPRTQANLPIYLCTNPLKCWTSSREAVNTNF